MPTVQKFPMPQTAKDFFSAARSRHYEDQAAALLTDDGIPGEALPTFATTPQGADEMTIALKKVLEASHATASPNIKVASARILQFLMSCQDDKNLGLKLVSSLDDIQLRGEVAHDKSWATYFQERASIVPEMVVDVLRTKEPIEILYNRQFTSSVYWALLSTSKGVRSLMELGCQDSHLGSSTRDFLLSQENHKKSPIPIEKFPTKLLCAYIEHVAARPFVYQPRHTEIVTILVERRKQSGVIESLLSALERKADKLENLPHTPAAVKERLGLLKDGWLIAETIMVVSPKKLDRYLNSNRLQLRGIVMHAVHTYIEKGEFKAYQFTSSCRETLRNEFDGSVGISKNPIRILMDKLAQRKREEAPHLIDIENYPSAQRLHSQEKEVE